MTSQHIARTILSIRSEEILRSGELTLQAAEMMTPVVVLVVFDFGILLVRALWLQSRMVD